MNAATIVQFADAAHRGPVVRLWRTIFGYETAHNDPNLSIEKKLAVGDDLFLVALVGTEVVGMIMAGYDGHRGWIYSLAVAPAHRHQGIGTQLVVHAEQALTRKGCLKINLRSWRKTPGSPLSTPRWDIPSRNGSTWGNE